MARIRTIKPEFFSDEKLATCSPMARLLAIALLQLVDSEGRMRLIPSQIAAHAFPWEAVDLSQLLHELFTIAYARKYQVSGREYLDIPGFVKHQRLSGKEAASKSKYPPHPVDLSGNDEPPDDREAKGKNFVLPGEAEGIPGTGEQGNRGTGIETSSLVGKNPDTKKPTTVEAKSILDHLNKKTGRRFEPVPANIKLIQARLGEYGQDKLRAVIDAKVAEWFNDAKMDKYLRPDTLFNATKCAQYVGQLGRSTSDSWRDDPVFRSAL